MTIRKKAAAVIIGACMGVIVPIGAMLAVSSNADAAVLVYDARNIEEAVKTAISTANILTNEEKQLALEILNTKTIDPRVLGDIYLKHKNSQQDILWGDASVDPETLKQQGKTPGVLNRGTTASNIFLNEIGNIENVLDGDMTLVDLYNQSQKNMRALDATYKDAAVAAQNVQSADAKLSSNVDAALGSSNEAEGALQAIQAGVNINAANAQATINGNVILSNLLAMEAERAYTQNMERAMKEKIEQNSKENLSNWVATFDK